MAIGFGKRADVWSGCQESNALGWRGRAEQHDTSVAARDFVRRLCERDVDRIWCSWGIETLLDQQRDDQDEFVMDEDEDEDEIEVEGGGGASEYQL